MSVKQLPSIGLLVKSILFYVLVSFHTLAQGPSELAVLSDQVQQLFKVDSELIDAVEVTQLSKKILDNRQHYSNDVLAKVFLLSARIASNQGDTKKVLQYAQNGLTVNTLDRKVKLLLTLKVASVYVAQKRYKQLLFLMDNVINANESSDNMKYQLLSLSYRSVAYSMLGKHHQALNDLKRVELGVNHSELKEQIELLTILAMAYHHLGDYQTSLTMQLKILKSRFEMGRMKNIDQTYLFLGYAYLYLQRFDDAYNAFWESKNYAISKSAAISIARANKGLGVVLVAQKQFQQAIAPLQEAIVIFKENQILDNQIETMVALAKAKIGVHSFNEGYKVLLDVISLLDGADISKEYAGFYRMVAEMYYKQQDYQTAYLWRAKHSQVLLSKMAEKKKKASLVQSLPHLALQASRWNIPSEQSKKLAVKLAENNEISSSFFEKYQKQRDILFSVLVLTCLLFIIVVTLLFKLRRQKAKSLNDVFEKLSSVITNPMQTKFDYQLAFKKARKFHYPFSVGYLIVENWQQLDFHFSNKTINAVTKEITDVIHENLLEFDYAGLLVKGEYLLMFEHQSDVEITAKLDKIVQAVNAIAFAELGDFSVTMKYSLNKPNFKDIDPYLFLARIAESVSIDKVNQPQVN
ncbi:tetratricopeptide repeat protein [Colwelliaceae bacterium MEBiC 14330]